MDQGLYIRSIFESVSDEDLKNHVRNFEVKKEELKALFVESPKRETEHSAGYDLAVVQDEVIPANDCKLITFGYSVSIENPSVTGVVVPRSSLAKKKGLTLVGGPKYIYSGSGENCLSLKFNNFTDSDVVLKAGEKIAQIVFIKYPSWIIGDFDALCDMESADATVLPDPLDEVFMSPLLDNNLEVIHTVDYYKVVNQAAKTTYYFQAPDDVILKPGKVYCIMTGLRCSLEPDQVFILKNAFSNPCVELANSIGVIDSDYYGNEGNGGEIGVLLLNTGIRDVTVHTGDVIASGAIYYFAKAEDDVQGGKRVGGFGSTDKR